MKFMIFLTPVSHLLMPLRPYAPRPLGTNVLRALFCGLVALLLPLPALPDAIVITKAMTASTIAEVFIGESGIRVELEIGGRDLDGFRNLMPDEVYQRMGHEPRPWGERLDEFFAEELVIRADGGSPLPGRLVEIEPRERVPRDEITGDPLPIPEGEGEPVVFAMLEYPLESRPETMESR
jgi:hypothetical protein